MSEGCRARSSLSLNHSSTSPELPGPCTSGAGIVQAGLGTAGDALIKLPSAPKERAKPLREELQAGPHHSRVSAPKLWLLPQQSRGSQSSISHKFSSTLSLGFFRWDRSWVLHAHLLHTDPSSETSYPISCDIASSRCPPPAINIYLFYFIYLLHLFSQWGKKELLQQWSAQTPAALMQINFER